MKKTYGRNPIFFQNKKKRFHVFIFTGLVIFLLQSCSATPPPRFYGLGMTTPPEEIKGTSLPLLYVLEPFLPQYLDRPQIVIRKTERELFMDERHRWASPLGELIGERITAGLNARLSSVRVLTGERALLHPAITMRLEIQILDFTSDSEGKTHLAGMYLLSRKEDSGQEIPFSLSTEFRGNSMDAKIASLGEVLDLLCAEIGDRMEASMPAKP